MKVDTSVKAKVELLRLEAKLSKIELRSAEVIIKLRRSSQGLAGV
jgi:hypothetical protein